MENIGDRIKAKRKALNLTIKQVHEKTGLSIGNISDMENNKYAPSTSSLIPLSQVLKCSIDWILTGSNYQDDVREVEKEVAPSQYSEVECDLIDMFRTLEESDKEDAFEIIKLKYERTVKRGKAMSSYSTYTNTQSENKSDTNGKDSGIA